MEEETMRVRIQGEGLTEDEEDEIASAAISEIGSRNLTRGRLHALCGERTDPKSNRTVFLTLLVNGGNPPTVFYQLVNSLKEGEIYIRSVRKLLESKYGERVQTVLIKAPN